MADSQSNTVIHEGWKLEGDGSVNTLTGSVGVVDPQSNIVTSDLIEDAAINKVNDLGEYENSKDIPKESSNIKSYKKSINATKNTNKKQNKIKNNKTRKSTQI